MFLILVCKLSQKPWNIKRLNLLFCRVPFVCASFQIRLKPDLELMDQIESFRIAVFMHAMQHTIHLRCKPCRPVSGFNPCHESITQARARMKQRLFEFRQQLLQFAFSP